MKTIVNLNEQLKTLLTGQSIKLDANTEGSFRAIIVDALCVARDVSEIESARAWALAQVLLKSTEDSFDVEDQDAEIVRKCVKSAHHMVQVREPVLACIVEKTKKDTAPSNPSETLSAVSASTNPAQ